MRDDRVEKLAHVLTEYSMEVKPGDSVVLSGGVLALPLLLAAYRSTLALGGNPAIEVLVPEVLEILLSEGSDEQLAAINPFERIGSEQADAHLRVGEYPFDDGDQAGAATGVLTGAILDPAPADGPRRLRRTALVVDRLSDAGPRPGSRDVAA